MLRKICTFFVLALLILNSSQILFGQNVVSGKIVSAATNEGLIGAGVGIMGTSEGVTIEDVEGTFSFETNQSFPIKLEVTYIGYVTKEVEVTKTNANILIALEEENIVINAIVNQRTTHIGKTKSGSVDCRIIGFISYKGNTLRQFLLRFG